MPQRSWMLKHESRGLVVGSGWFSPREHLLILRGVAAFDRGLSAGGYSPRTAGGRVNSDIWLRQAVAVTSPEEEPTCPVGPMASVAVHRHFDRSTAIRLAAGPRLSVPLAALPELSPPSAFLKAGAGVVTRLLLRAPACVKFLGGRETAAAQRQ